MDSKDPTNSATITYYNETEYYIGVGLAVISTLFIGSSFIVKKKALIRLQAHGSLRAGSGGFGYLKEWLWWAGFLSMGIGEVANFAAYAFAPASLVTPLGALSVLVAAVLASKFLHERLNLLGKLGCFLCIVGSTIIILHSPKSEEIESIEILMGMLAAPEFITYVVIVVIVFISIYFYFGPLYGHRNVIVYISLCSAVGSISVMSCKALGLAIRETINGTNEVTNWLVWFCLVSVILCISIQMNYLNKALDLFSTGMVTPVYYVLFTTLVIVASSILFKEWKHMSVENVIGSLCGFSTVVVAIIMLNGLKDVDVSFNDVQSILKSRSKEESRNGGKYRSDEESLIGKDKNNLNYGIKNG